MYYYSVVLVISEELLSLPRIGIILNDFVIFGFGFRSPIFLHNESIAIERNF